MRSQFLGFLAVLLIVAVGYNTYQGIDNASSLRGTQAGIAASANKSCQVQAVGLRAQPYLTRIMSDIAILLEPRPGQKVTPGTPVKTIEAVGDLRQALGAYVALQSQQPKSRKC